MKSPTEIKSILICPEHLKYKVFICHLSKAELKKQGKNHALEYIRWGELQDYDERPTCSTRDKWWDLGLRTLPNVAWVKSINNSHRQAFIDCDALVDQRLYEIRSEEGRLLSCILNSFVFFLAKELYGRVNLGEGALDTAVYEADIIPLLNTSTIDHQGRERLEKAFEQIARREIRSVFEELGLPKPNSDYSNIYVEDISLDGVLPDRRELDRVVFEALGLTEEEQLEVYKAVVELVKNRLVKAGSV